MKIEAGKYYKTRDGRKVGPMKHNRDDNEPFVWTSADGGNWSHNGEDGLATGPLGSLTEGDLISEWTDECAHPFCGESCGTPAIGTLAELDVKPGDVVEFYQYAPEFDRYAKYIGVQMTGRIDGGVEFYDTFKACQNGFSEPCSHKFRLISRATPTPSIDLTAITTPFGLLDKATQDALIAHGGPYQCYMHGGWRGTDSCNAFPDLAIRVKPNPKRETVTEDAWIDRLGVLVCGGACGNCTVTYDTIDGVIDMATYRVVAK